MQHLLAFHLDSYLSPILVGLIAGAGALMNYGAFGARLNAHDRQLADHDDRLTRHDQRLNVAEQDVARLEERTSHA
jgi:hypothetical protein